MFANLGFEEWSVDFTLQGNLSQNDKQLGGLFIEPIKLRLKSYIISSDFQQRVWRQTVAFTSTDWDL